MDSDVYGREGGYNLYIGVTQSEQRTATPDLSRLETLNRLSQSAVDGFFAIVDKWHVPVGNAGDLLGGMPRSSVYKLKTAAGTLRQDELTRISYVVGIYKAILYTSAGRPGGLLDDTPE